MAEVKFHTIPSTTASNLFARLRHSHAQKLFSFWANIDVQNDWKRTQKKKYCQQLLSIVRTFQLCETGKPFIQYETIFLIEWPFSVNLKLHTIPRDKTIPFILSLNLNGILKCCRCQKKTEHSCFNEKIFGI